MFLMVNEQVMDNYNCSTTKNVARRQALFCKTIFEFLLKILATLNCGAYGEPRSVVK